MFLSKLSFLPQKPQDTAKHENCHTENVPQIRKWQLPVKFRQLGSVESTYLLNCFCNSFPLHQSNVLTTDMFFYPLDNEHQRVCSEKNSPFVYIWKVVHIQKTKLPVAITNIINCPFRNWTTAFSWTWFSYVLLQLLSTLFVVLLTWW